MYFIYFTADVVIGGTTIAASNIATAVGTSYDELTYWESNINVCDGSPAQRCAEFVLDVGQVGLAPTHVRILSSGK